MIHNKQCRNRQFIAVFLTFVLALSLIGCSVLQPPEAQVKSIQDWSFQYNESSSDYSLFFEVCDQDDQPLAVNASVDIRIEDKEGNVLFDDTAALTPENFDYFTSQIRGEKYLAEIRIPKDWVTPGKSPDGTVYFTFYNDDYFAFDECNTSILMDLPTQEITILTEDLPKEVAQTSSYFGVEGKYRIDRIELSSPYKYSTDTVTVTVYGEKTMGNTGTGSFDSFNFKLYDSSGYTVDSGSILLQNLQAGDKFKDDSLLLYGLIPGETYTLVFENNAWG